MVGVVYIGISDKYGTSVYRLQLEGDRESVRLEAANELLSTLLARIEAY
jgi:nicotinamide mononucleotide (NMN) deamidase PncC